MRLVLLDSPDEVRLRFQPLSFSRPLWELRCGMTSLAEKLIAKVDAIDIVYFVPPYMAEAYRARVDRPVNSVAELAGDDLLVVDPRVKADAFDVEPVGPSHVGLDDEGRVLYARVAREDAARLPSHDIGEFLAAAKAAFPNLKSNLPTWNYLWDLILANPEQITADFAAAGQSGIDGKVEEPSAIRSGAKDLYVAPGAAVHPMVVIDAKHGPIYIDEGAVIHPFTRIEGPCYVGKKSLLLGAKCREGNSIGPACRIGGEVEESIIQGYSNKYHDGFLGHAYVGEWVNLGALTTTSDLKNNYGPVRVWAAGSERDSGSNKLGSIIGAHVKTGIGTLLPTGCSIGAGANLFGGGRFAPKRLPAFSWWDGERAVEHRIEAFLDTTAVAMGRRGVTLQAADAALLRGLFAASADERERRIAKELEARSSRG